MAGRRVGSGELVAGRSLHVQAQLTSPPTPPAERRVIGKPLPRVRSLTVRFPPTNGNLPRTPGPPRPPVRTARRAHPANDDGPKREGETETGRPPLVTRV